MLRDSWEFEFSVGDVLKAAETKRIYHTERVEHWTEEREKAEADLRAAGVEIREHEATGGTQFTAVLDVEKTAWLNQCNRKLETHQLRAQQFDAWIYVLRSRPLFDSLKLQHDDVRFFGLSEEPLED